MPGNLVGRLTMNSKEHYPIWVLLMTKITMSKSFHFS